MGWIISSERKMWWWWSLPHNGYWGLGYGWDDWQWATGWMIRGFREVSNNLT
jgi:hypothetical protein